MKSFSRKNSGELLQWGPPTTIRTGTIVACYRMGHDGWTNEQALEEARHYGLSAWQFGMTRYIREYSPPAAAAN